MSSRLSEGHLSAQPQQRIRKRPLFLRRIPLIFASILLLLIVGASVSAHPHPYPYYYPVPTMTVHSVVTDDLVNISGVNFPPNQTFTVRMGEMGTAAIGGIVVDSINIGNSSSFSSSFKIPDALKGRYQISIRLDSAYGYYSYNWFYNNTTGTPPSPSMGYYGIPTIHIKAVEQDKKVTITTYNFPPNQEFTVTMGLMYTAGIGGQKVATFNSETGGSFEKTFDIPASLKGQHRISIRTQTAHAYPYFSYNWFYNNSTAVMPGTSDPVPPPPPPPTPQPQPVYYTGIPTFKVCTVEQNKSITILSNNFPPNQTFRVTMGSMYTAGIGGYDMGTVTTDGNGLLIGDDTKLTIPPQLAGAYRISVRLQTAHPYPYYAYNWFYNNTAAVCP